MPAEIMMNYAVTFIHVLNHFPLEEISLSNDFIAQVCIQSLKSKDENIRNQIM